MTVTVDNRREREFLRRMAEAEKLSLKVGVFGEKASAKDGDTGVTVGEIADWHEYGRGNNPERSFIRATVDESRAKIQEMIRKAAVEVGEGRMSARLALDRVGLFIAGQVRKRISAGIPPPLTAAYLKRKGEGKTTPLIKTGQLRNSIDSAVVEGRQ